VNPSTHNAVSRASSTVWLTQPENRPSATAKT
jgi:hypothetical protein